MSISPVPSKDELKKAEAQRRADEHWNSNKKWLIGLGVLLIFLWLIGFRMPEIHIAGY